MKETLYVDSSAIAKRYLDEPGSEEAVAASVLARIVVTSRIAFTEVARAITRDEPLGVDAPVYAGWEADWEAHQIVEVTQDIAEHAARLADQHELRTLDALHLASALSVTTVPLRFATWDRRLHAAARAAGLRVVPASLS